ncbi:hypothetical protein PoB_005689900 [Plakobranchus ocellatus]|uniref:Protein kinase domain-containing protein n=1 Tax=Plakobranchus ocellatus TaxID=259542 RepID=A0AAV4CCS1_9GAST|nr:hypothetical protein PoB_005689900 [Plakobranchus ocellatus]
MDNSNTSRTRSVKRKRSLMENNEFPQREGDDQSLNPTMSSQTCTDSTAPHSAVHGSHQNLRQKRRRLVAVRVAEASETGAEDEAIVISRRNTPDPVSTRPLREAADPAAQRETNAMTSSPQSAIPKDGTATARSEITTTDAFSLGAVLMCLLIGVDWTGRQREDQDLLANCANWPHRPVFNMLRTFGSVDRYFAMKSAETVLFRIRTLHQSLARRRPRCGRPF